MLRQGLIAFSACATVLASVSSASAQSWGRGPTPRQGACFYRDANYEGDYFCMRAGDEYDSVPSGMNDGISSIRIYGGAEVTVYKNGRFKGGSKRFERNVRNLRDEGWNDRISSVRIDGSSYGGGHRPPQGSNGNPDQVVRRAYRDVLDREPDASGLRLYRSRIIDDGWSEAQVRDALRKSPEYREKTTMTRQKAQEIVRNAYLAVLHREPDAASQGYVDRVYRDKWTQQDVERELRKSPEYRQR